ncbi:MAG TPA: hypothetical protein DCY07_04495 [Rhodospirillaceae bacterium]|nr:hypothetical protein [Rhodospirillaceae bacterium]
MSNTNDLATVTPLFGVPNKETQNMRDALARYGHEATKVLNKIPTSSPIFVAAKGYLAVVNAAATQEPSLEASRPKQIVRPSAAYTYK